MRYLSASLLSAAAMVFAAAPATAQDDTQTRGVSADLQMRLNNSFIFVFDESVSGDRVEGRAQALVNRVGGSLTHTYTAAIQGFTAKMNATAAERLAANNPSIAYFEEDQPMFAVQGNGGGGGSSPPPQETPWGVNRVNGGVDATGLEAYIIDTGIDLDHDDLNVDASRSVNFVSKGPNNGGDDENGHGSHVAGSLGAIDNDIGVVGVAENATLISVRVLDRNGSGSLSDVIDGVDHVAANADAGDVANMSLGGGTSDSLDSAVENAADQGILFSIAAGNDSADAGNTSPARVEHANVYTVSAMDDTDSFASFSNFGNPPIECAGPGVDVFSTWKDNEFDFLSGTSMSAPHIGGILLVNSGDPNFDGNVNDDPDGDPDPICVVE